MVDTLGASKPVIHIAQTNTIRSGSSAALNRSARPCSFIRLRCGRMSRPWRSRWAISFCDCETTTAMSVPLRPAPRLGTATSIPSGRQLLTGSPRARPGAQGRWNQPQRDGGAAASRDPRSCAHHQGHPRIAAPALLYGRRGRRHRPGARSAHRQLRAHDPASGVQGRGALGSARSQPGRRRRPAAGRPEG